MEKWNEIAVELSALSALVGGIGRDTPYGVPAGYFDQLPSQVMGRIASKSSTFQVPNGYFDNFATSVLARIKAGSSSPGIPTGAGAPESAQEEIARLSATISRISRATPYQLPEGYFDELSPVLTILREEPAYVIPDGYFEEISPILTVAHDRSTYQVPEGYFSALPDTILEKVAAPVTTHRESAKVLKGNWWRYSTAAAAAIAACFLLIFSWPQVDTIKVSDETAQLGLQNLSDREIQAYLDDEHAILAEPAVNNTATLDMNEGEVKSLLGGVTDDDLQQYMEEHGKAEDLATN